MKVTVEKNKTGVIIYEVMLPLVALLIHCGIASRQ